ncbi:DUF6702 family protein [Pirellulaceae bacterium SH449]
MATTVGAHPFHICVGQMRWNEEERYWELSLRLHPQDLEQSMQRWRLNQSRDEIRSGRPVEALLAGCRVEDAEFENHVVEFLNQHFFLSTETPVPSQGNEAAGNSEVQLEPANRSQLVWVGKEFEKAWVWLHMELHPPKRANTSDTLFLCHKVLLGEIPEQENSIVVEQAGRNRFSLQFSGDQIAKPLEPASAHSSTPNAIGDGISGDHIGEESSGPKK